MPPTTAALKAGERLRVNLVQSRVVEERQSKRVCLAAAFATTIDRETGLPELLAACRGLLAYRRRVGPLGFQLEKADDHLRQIEAAIAAMESTAP